MAVKHFKTKGPNNVLEYIGRINLIIVKVDLAAVFTKNCVLLEDYKHWSPPRAACQVHHGGQGVTLATRLQEDGDRDHL